MTYAVFILKGQNYIHSETIYTRRGDQRNVITYLKKKYKKGKFWITPVRHSTFVFVNKGKIVDKIKYFK